MKSVLVAARNGVLPKCQAPCLHKCMPKLQTYRTGFWVHADTHSPRSQIRGKGWHLRLVKDRSSPPKVYDGREVIVCAASWKTAQQAVFLIYDALVLINGEPLTMFSRRRPIAYSETIRPSDGMSKELVEFARGFTLITPDVADACQLAAKASFNRHWCYALTKYYLSCDNYSTPIVDLDPENARNLRLSPFFDDHVCFAVSIMLAYSAIEELGLHIKASEAKPSRLPSGQWNPEVKQDLEDRLHKAGVDLTESFLWSVRGPSRRIDKRRPPRFEKLASWSRGQVRDSYIGIPDAIAGASWLRSKVATHGFNQLASSLSPYDVANVQHLARRLILECVGFWRFEARKRRRRRHAG